MPDSDGLFDSAWLKCAWAVRHSNSLKRSLNAFADHLHEQPVAPLLREYDPKKHCIIFRLPEIPTPPPYLSAYVGDVIHNYRCSLDHLAWALVCRGRTPPATLTEKQQRDVYFPIYRDRLEYNASLKKKLPGVRSKDRKIVRRHQPYLAPKRKRAYHILSVLEDLSNKDKHRTVEPVYNLPSDSVVKILSYSDCTVTRIGVRARRFALEVGAEVCRVYVRKTGPNPDVEVNVSISPNPAIHDLLEIVHWLEKTESFVVRLLLFFSRPPDYISDGTLDELP